MSTATKSGFAREHDVSRTTVARWVRRGIAVETDQGRIERELSNRNLADRPIVYRGGTLGGNGKGNPWASNGRCGRAAKMIQDALGIESEDVANYCFPQTWPTDRERRARIIGEWLKTEARFLAPDSG